MALGSKDLILISTGVCLISVVHAMFGMAVVYNPPYFPSRCYGSSDKGVMVAKAHSGLFVNNGTTCGSRYRVRCLGGTNKAIRDACTGNTVDVMVIDRCEKCAVNELVLSREAFEKIARLALGRVNIEFNQI